MKHSKTLLQLKEGLGYVFPLTSLPATMAERWGYKIQECQVYFLPKDHQGSMKKL